jgi:hypothetical protein
MELTARERLALKLIFAGSDDLSREVRKRIHDSTVVDRDESGVGFFATIRFDHPLERIPAVRMREFNFKHPAFPYGGSFMCRFENAQSVELEAVTFGGAQWPRHLDESLFTELI